MNGTGGSNGWPSVTRSVRSSPSLPIAYSGSTPPNGVFGARRAGPAGGGGTSPTGPCARGRRAGLSAAAPLPGSPTALVARPPPPPPPPPKDVGASGVRRLGAAISPPGQRHVLPSSLPVAAA